MYPVNVMNGKAVRINIKEALRYMGCKDINENDSVLSLAKEMQEETERRSILKACFARVPVSIKNDFVNFDFMKTKSKALSLNLKTCSEAFVFAVTIGADIDRMILKYSQISPSKALVSDALASAAVEEWCNQINCELSEKLKEENKFLKSRFSCGYGDFDIGCQKEILDFLDTSRKIGVSLSDGGMMLPIKSVTAVVGITSDFCECESGCAICENKDNCLYKKAE